MAADKDIVVGEDIREAILAGVTKDRKQRAVDAVISNASRMNPRSLGGPWGGGGLPGVQHIETVERTGLPPRPPALGIGGLNPQNEQIIGKPNPAGESDKQAANAWRNVLSKQGLGGPAPARPIPLTTTEAAPQTVAGPAKTGGQAAVKDDDLYDAIAALDDETFVRFMKDNPDIPGLGYVKDASGRMVRMAENPARKKPQAMTNYEIETAAKGLTAAGQLQAGIGARENAGEAKKANDAYKQAQLNEKADGSVRDWINDLGKDPLTDSINPEKAFYTIARDGIELPPNMSDEYGRRVRLAIKKAYAPVEEDIKAWEEAKKRKATRAELLEITKTYEQGRGW